MGLFERIRHDAEKEQLAERVEELERENRTLKEEDDRRGSTTLTEEQRAALIEKARADLPELSERVDKSVEELRRLARKR